MQDPNRSLKKDPDPNKIGVDPQDCLEDGGIPFGLSLEQPPTTQPNQVSVPTSPFSIHGAFLATN